MEGGERCYYKHIFFYFDFVDHPMHFNIGDVRLRHCANLNTEYTKSFNRDPEDPSAAALKVCETTNQRLELYFPPTDVFIFNSLNIIYHWR